ncbi:MAG: cyclase family protein [Candidatus Hydrogenedentes bacterium]|nr:cyclase family protein [Candidatus Hydrogenedentota bacterium]
MRWIDVTIPMMPGMTVWPGDPAFTLAPAARIADGANCNVSTLTLSTHTGTHCDAPWHFEDSGKKLDEIDTSVFFGDALVIDLPNVDMIRADDLRPETLPPRVLFKTRNSGYPINAPFNKDYVALDRCAAQRCVDDGVRLVGVDYLSVAPYKQPQQPTHHILLQANVFVVEGLSLNQIAAGTYPFVVLPMHVAGADGAPCRAFIGIEEHRA